jgi:hypothetical protein
MTRFKKRIFRNYLMLAIIAVSVISVLSISVLSLRTKFNLFSRAAGLSSLQNFSLEAENGVLSGSITKVTNDSSASNNGYVLFGQTIGGNFQPSAPYYATFFYPWSENPNTDGHWGYWNDQGQNPPTTWFSHYIPDPQPGVFNPSQELYSSRNDAILYWQLSKMREAKQEVAISSWWGQNHKTDIAFRKIVTDVMNRADNPYPNLRWTVYYENEGFGDPSQSQLVSDLNYIAANYVNQPGFFKINNRPVIFVYGNGADTCPMAQRWVAARNQANGNFYLVLKVYPGFGSCTSQPDSWHEYAPANANHGDSQGPYAFAAPGFWLDDGSTVRVARDTDPSLPNFTAAVQRMVSAPSSVIWRLTETWNEWGEGTSVEPGQQTMINNGQEVIDPNGVPFGNRYIDVLNRLLPPLENGVVPTSTPVPSVTTMPTPTPPSVTSMTVTAAGDIACNSSVATASGCQQQATSNLIAQINPQAVLALGDEQYESGEYANFMQFYNPTWGRFKRMTYPVPGNHEFGSGGTGYYQYFYDGTNPTITQNDPQHKGYYSVDLTNTWHMVALNLDPCINNNLTACDAEVAWLKNDLQTHPSQCTLAIFHEAYYTSGTRGPETASRPLVQLLYDNNADLILSGHQHFYERFAPQDVDNHLDTQRGIRSFTVGTGGKDSPTLGNITYPNLEIRKAPAFGVLKLNLNSNGYNWQFVSIPGQTFTDSGSANCH